MSSERHEFTGPEAVASLMAGYSAQYLRTYASDSFLFEWLRKTKELEVQCSDATEEKIVFSTPPELLNAIHRCGKINVPEKTRLPSDYGFSGFMTAALSEVLGEVPFTTPHDFEGPILRRLSRVVVNSYPRILGKKIFRISDNHWSCYMRDHSSPFDERQDKPDRRDYFLRSEILAIVSIFYHQIYNLVYRDETDKYRRTLRYKEGLLTVTVVTFCCKKVRVVQGTCNPSEKHTTLAITLRAVYNLSHDNYDKTAAFDAMKWILTPPEPAKQLLVRGGR
ncbi:hypothetical protein EMCG_04459 [[Emmonsia] crescens]|uniref:Uncharacterized protein n=1 Tax=[Emmonsia] crescens TaxID=73230 RepID=A0A0G2HS62_9EURO|nr:hypothetical protein EMCG_04459 [Emmonsia crescens UAMH 3008]